MGGRREQGYHFSSELAKGLREAIGGEDTSTPGKKDVAGK